MSLIHFTLPADAARLDAVIRATGHSPAPKLPDLTSAPDRTAAWAWGSTAYLHLAQQTPNRARFDFGASAIEDGTSQLLDAAADKAAAWGLSSMIGYAQNGLEGTAEMLERSGFAAAGEITLLQADQPPALNAEPVPDGYFLKRFDDFKHLPTLAALLNRAYGDRFGRPENEHKAVTVETIQAKLAASGDEALEQRLHLILNFFGKGVAVIRTHENGPIEAPGVVPEERHNQLHTLLLAHTLQQTGTGPVSLYACSEEPGWLDEYISAGFKVQHTWIGYHKDL